MPLVVVGSVALDNVVTPTEQRNDLLGGSAAYFSYAASYFTPVKLVSVVGDDWPDEHTKLFQSRNVDTAGLQVVPGAKTFRWTGKYAENMNERETLDVQLNALEQWDPVLPEAYRRCKFLFLANDPPALQMNVMEQCPGAALTVADTMDLWINSQRSELLELLKRIDGLMINDSEAILLTGEPNIVLAGHLVRE
ncbi:MAG: sugar kinase, partial [Candidatus Nealsonbacteria bacterium]|nr:sugar kinase [Candidatus Nealsonbacteria bacterium]